MSDDAKNSPGSLEDETEISKYAEVNARDENRIGVSAGAKIILSFIPGGGAAIEVLNGIEAIKQSRQGKMLRILVEKLGVDIEEIQRILSTDDELADLVMRGLDAARKAAFDEKLEVLADVIVGCMEPEGADRIYARILFQVLEVVEREHVELLLIIKNWPVIPNEIPEKERSKLQPTLKTLREKSSKLKPIVGIVVSSLLANGLIRDFSAGTYGGLAESHYAVDDLGYRLLKYLEKEDW